jgi:hypothetical protein
MEMPISSPEVEFNEMKELKPKLGEVIYHGQSIKVLEVEHKKAFNIESESYKRPDNWRFVLAEQIKSSQGDIAPEYCTPELAIDRAYIEPITGKKAENITRIDTAFDDPTVNEFYDYVACLAAVEGKHLVAVDTADTFAYVPYELLSVLKFNLAKKMGNLPPTANYHGEYMNIQPYENTFTSSQDARHLITARGALEHSLNAGVDVTVITSPVHAERNLNYMERQIEAETKSQKQVTKAADLKEIASLEEKWKMLFYGKGGLERNIREYAPQLKQDAYKIDMSIQEFAGSIDVYTFSNQETEVRIAQLTEQIDAFTDQEFDHTNSYETKYREQLKDLKDTLTKTPRFEPENFISGDDLAREWKNWTNKILVQASTRRHWKLVSKKYIY